MPLLRARFGSIYDVPAEPFDVADGHPAAIGLKALWLPGVAHDGQQLINLAPERVPGVQFLPPATSDVPAPTTILQGPAALFTGALGGGYYRRSTAPWLSGTLTCTIACMFTWGGSQTGFPSFYGLTNGSGGDRYYSLVPNSGSLAYNINLGQGDIIINAVSMTAGHTYLAIGTTRAANDHEVMVLNVTTGAIAGGTSRSGAGASNPTLTDEVLGGANYGSHNYLDGRVAAAFGWSRGFSQAELRDFVAQPWDMLVPRGRTVRGFVASGGGITGEAALTDAADSASATGSVGVGGATATADVSDAMAAGATVTVAGAGTVGDASDGVGAGGGVSVGGSSAVADAPDAASGTGSVAIAASLPVADGPDAALAGGQVGIVGTALLGDAADGISAAGSAPIAGAGAVADGADLVVAGAAAAVTAAAGLADGDDSIVATGGSAAVIVGSATLQDGPDASTGFGSLALAGTGALADAADTTIAVGAVPVTAGAALADGADATGGGVSVPVAGTAALADTADQIAASAVGELVSTGDAALVDGPDAAASSGAVGVGGVGHPADAADGVAAAAAVRIAASATLTDLLDLTPAQGAILIGGGGAIGGADDALVFTGLVGGEQVGFRRYDGPASSRGPAPAATARPPGDPALPRP